MSLELLTEDDSVRFEELAIFPEDVDVPLNAVVALWGRTASLDDFETEEPCGRLFGLSLLLDLDLATRRIRLHDVVRAYLQTGQKKRVPALHAELIEAGFGKVVGEVLQEITVVRSRMPALGALRSIGRASVARCCSTISGCAGSWRSRASTG